MQRKEMKPRWYFLKKKKVWNLKFSLSAQSRLGKDEGLLYPLKHAWKIRENFIILLFLQLYIIGKVDSTNTNLAST